MSVSIDAHLDRDFIPSPTLIARFSIDLNPDLGDPSIIARQAGFVK
jgi:hypothetical protein